METLSLHILDIAENSIRAGAKKIMIGIQENQAHNLLTVRIEDDGQGMDQATAQKALDPFFTTKSGKRIGLGLALLSQAAQQTGGELTLDTEPGQGTKVKACFKLNHPDLQPMGNIMETLAVLVTGHPEIRFIYDHKGIDNTYHFDSHKGN
jgi:signal transduction histidine kinase